MTKIQKTTYRQLGTTALLSMFLFALAADRFEEARDALVAAIILMPAILFYLSKHVVASANADVGTHEESLVEKLDSVHGVEYKQDSVRGSLSDWDKYYMAYVDEGSAGKVLRIDPVRSERKTKAQSFSRDLLNEIEALHRIHRYSKVSKPYVDRIPLTDEDFTLTSADVVQPEKAPSIN